MARKGLGGHHGYDQSRNALEILEKQDVLDPAKRCERAAYLRDVEDREANELVHLGYEVIDLLRAGFNETELLGKEGVTDAMLLDTREAIAVERRANKPPRRRARSRAASSAASKGNLQIMARAASSALSDAAARRASRSASKVAPDS